MGNRIYARMGCLGVSMLLLPAVVLADDVEGTIERVDAASRSIVVAGVTYYAHEGTDFDDELTRFEDLTAGQRVEIDFDVREGRNYIREIEIDD